MGTRKLAYGLILLLVAVLLGLLLLRNLQKPATNENQITNQSTDSSAKTSPIIINGIIGVLAPKQLNTNTNEEFVITYSLTNINELVTASDLLLSYNQTALEFVRIDNLNSNYLNPRAINDDERLILSFIAKLDVAPSNDSVVVIADLVFRPLQSGSFKIEPILNNDPASSIVTISGSNLNQLQTINSVNLVVQ